MDKASLFLTLGLMMSAPLVWAEASASDVMTTSSQPVSNHVSDANTPADASTAMAQKQYVVQLGAFTDEFQAIQWRQKINDLNIKTFILPAEHNNGVMRIRTGPFATKQAAQEMLKKLQQNGIDSAIILPENSSL